MTYPYKDSLSVETLEQFKYTVACVEILRGIKDEHAPFEKLVLAPAVHEYLELFKGRKQDVALRQLADLYVKYREESPETCLEDALNIIDSFSLEGRRVQGVYVSRDFARLVGRIAECYECESVFEPFAGKATFAQFLPKQTSYLGQEINPWLYKLAQLRLELLDRGNSTIMQGDSFYSYQPSDMIVSEIPWGAVGSENQHSEPYFFQEAGVFAKKISVGIYPYGFLFRSGRSEKTARTNLLADDLVECVIKLPARLYAPYASVQTCIVITNRHKVRKGVVRFIDASSCVLPKKEYTRLDVDRLIQIIQGPEQVKDISLLVTNEEILNNNAVLAMENYLPVEMPQIPDGCDLVPLKSLLTSITTRKRTDETEVPLIRVSDLAANPFLFTLGETVPDVRKYEQRLVYVDEPALFISRLRPLKPTYFVAKCGGVYINPNVYAFRVDKELVSPQYLMNELTKDYVQKQLLYTGTVIPTLMPTSFLDVRIILPRNRAEQDISYVKGVQEENVRRENILSDELEVYLEEWGQRQHTLNHVVGNLDDLLSLLAAHEEKKGGVLKDDDIISEDETVKDCYAKLEYTQHRLAQLVDGLADGIAYEPASTIEIIHFVEQYLKNYPHVGYALDPVYDKKAKYEVRFSEKRLLDVFENIFSNIKKHGFVDERKDYVIRVEIKEDELKGAPAVSVLFMNNGRGLEPTMSPEKVFKYGESTHGSGKGGSRIKLSVRTYGGDVAFLLADELEDGFTTAYKIVLPIV